MEPEVPRRRGGAAAETPDTTALVCSSIVASIRPRSQVQPPENSGTTTEHPDSLSVLPKARHSLDLFVQATAGRIWDFYSSLLTRSPLKPESLSLLDNPTMI
jgi:hypothetical protein